LRYQNYLLSYTKIVESYSGISVSGISPSRVQMDSSKLENKKTKSQ